MLAQGAGRARPCYWRGAPLERPTTRYCPAERSHDSHHRRPALLSRRLDAGSSEPLIARIRHLLGLAIAYDLPCLATFEQPVEKKGWLPEALESAFPANGRKLTKHTFNCCGEPAIQGALRSMSRSQLAVAGGETDVCLLQSVLGLISEGYQIFLLEDCLFSSEPHVGPALRRMEQAGAIPSTVKTLSYELRQSVANPSEQARLARVNGSVVLGDPEALPEWTPAL